MDIPVSYTHLPASDVYKRQGYTDTGYINWNHELTMMSVPAHTPFWYVRDLIVLVIMSPLIYFLLKRLMGGANSYSSGNIYSYAI